MKKNLSKDYFLYIILKCLSYTCQRLPLKLVLFLGSSLGRIVYHLDKKHRQIVWKNLRIVFAKEKSILELKEISKENFLRMGMNLMEIFVFLFKRDYLLRYTEIDGLENLKKALEEKKGVILLGIHMGNWEICFALAKAMGIPLYILAEKQRKFPLLNKFLNEIRLSAGVKIIYAGQAKEAIRILKEGKVLGVVADHGIKEGIDADFFGRKVLTPTLAMRLALKTDAFVLPAYIFRRETWGHRLVIMPPLKIEKSYDFKTDLVNNLTKVNRVFEEVIREHPYDYLWSYRRFKYNKDIIVLILEDGITGHIRQSEALVELIKEVASEKGLLVKVERVKVEFKNRFFKTLQSLAVGSADKSYCRQCLWCLKNFLTQECFLKIKSIYADIVISCGTSVVGVNFVVSSLNQAKSIVIMRPSFLSTKRFNLVIIPKHDRPLKRKNIIVTLGALNLINEDYLKEHSDKLREYLGVNFIPEKDYIGLLIGGDAKNFHLEKDTVSDMICQIKSIAEKFSLGILVTTSRRTNKEIEVLVKKEFMDYPLCKFLVIANEYNPSFAIGGILGLSRIVIISPESISMISEAASSHRYVIVFQATIDRKHKDFLYYMNKNEYIYTCLPKDLSKTMEKLLREQPTIKILNDKQVVKEGLRKIL